MKVIIVCHTEFGLVQNRDIIFDKTALDGVRIGVRNLMNLTRRYGAKITFAIMPEVIDSMPPVKNHEIGLHIHAGWQKFEKKGFEFDVGDSYLREHCKQSSDSTLLSDYLFDEQLGMIRAGKDYIEDRLGITPTSFVAGRWSINNNTIRALTLLGITHECSTSDDLRTRSFYRTKISSVGMPYRPSSEDYRDNRDLPILMLPISRMPFGGNVSPELIPYVGISWLKACFLEYYQSKRPLFHICMHSPVATNPYFLEEIDELLNFISKKDIEFECASNIQESDVHDMDSVASSEMNSFERLKIYLPSMNRDLIRTGFNKLISTIIYR